MVDFCPCQPRTNARKPKIYRKPFSLSEGLGPTINSSWWNGLDKALATAK